jgi:hypothetical protein
MATFRSARGVRKSVSVAETGDPEVCETDAVVISVPVAAGLMSAVNEKTTVAPTGILRVVDRAPLPDEGPVTDPPPVVLTNAQVAPVTPGGSGRLRVTPSAFEGPALAAVTV